MKLSLLHEAGNRRDFLKKFFNKGSKMADQESTPQPEPTPEPESTLTPKPDRRQFLHKAGGLAAVAAHSNPLVKGVSSLMTAGSALSAFDKMADDRLLNTPEEEWIGQISPQRRRQMATKYPDHGKNEAVAKLTKILVYGVAKNRGVNPQAAKYAADIAARASKALGLISKNWKLKQSDIMATAVNQGCFSTEAEAQKFGNFLRQNGEKFNVNMDLGQKLHKAEAPSKEYEQHKAGVKNWQEKMKAMNTNRELDNDAISRWEGEGGAFESKLTTALSLI